LGDLGSGKGGGFLAIHTHGSVSKHSLWLDAESRGDDLPGSAESQSGTKPAVEEELLKLISCESKKQSMERTSEDAGGYIEDVVLPPA
jgi:hypothetical protein